MYSLGFFIIVALFLTILFLNVFFRVKVFKIYKYLVQNNVEFTARHFFNEQSMEKEVLSRYPEHRKEILTFVRLIKQSMTWASLLIALIIAFGFLLLRNR